MEVTRPVSNNATEDFALHIFLYKLTKKCTSKCPKHKQSMQLLEEDALKLCHLLIKGGYFSTNDVNGCAVCAIETLEKKIIMQMRQQMEVVRKARSYYSQPENAKYYKLCTKHQPSNHNFTHNLNHAQYHQVQPQLQAQLQAQIQTQIQAQLQPQMQPKPQYHGLPPMVSIPSGYPLYSEPTRYYVHYPVVPTSYTYVPESVPSAPPLPQNAGPQFSFDSFIPIPVGVDPVGYMTNYNEWVRHLQQFYGTNNHKRMPYTTNFPLEMSDERKTVGRRFV